MPAYPCSQCKTPVDVRDFTCKNCHSKTPFKCTRCDTSMNAMDIFEAEKVTFQKPIFCNKCGPEVRPATCPHCKLDVYRGSGVDDDGVLYHQDCYKTVSLQKKVTYPLRVVLMLFLGYACYSQFTFHTGSVFAGLGFGAGGGVLGWLLGGLMAPRR